MADGPLTAPGPISAAHNLDGFDCGQPDLNDWLRDRAMACEGRSARTYVVCSDSQVIGYYCLAAAAEHRHHLPRKIRQGNPDPTPLMLIGRLAVDIGFQGRGIGAALLKDALLRILAAAAIVGTRAVLVHAIDEAASAFYKKYGFIEFPQDARTYFLPIETINTAL